MKAHVPFAMLATALAMAAMGAPWMTASHPLAVLAVRSFFSPVCHQNPARSFFMDGSPVAVCVRCLGIYCGMAIGAWLSLSMGTRLRVPIAAARQFFFAALSLNLLDSIAESLHLHGNLPMPRLLLGAALGLAVGVLMCSRQEADSSFEPLASSGCD